MGKKIIKDSTLTSIANAIRAKAETTTPMSFPDGFISTLDGIPTGGSGDGYKIATGVLSFPTKTQGFPSMHFDFNVVGAIMMIQDVSNTDRVSATSYIVDSVTSLIGGIGSRPGLYSSTSSTVLQLETTEVFKTAGNELSWSSYRNRARYFWGNYFYFVWGN